MLKEKKFLFPVGDSPCTYCYIPPPVRKLYGRPLTMDDLVNDTFFLISNEHHKIYQAHHIFYSFCALPHPTSPTLLPQKKSRHYGTVSHKS